MIKRNGKLPNYIGDSCTTRYGRTPHSTIALSGTKFHSLKL